MSGANASVAVEPANGNSLASAPSAALQSRTVPAAALAIQRASALKATARIVASPRATECVSTGVPGSAAREVPNAHDPVGAAGDGDAARRVDRERTHRTAVAEVVDARLRDRDARDVRPVAEAQLAAAETEHHDVAIAVDRERRDVEVGGAFGRCAVARQRPQANARAARGDEPRAVGREARARRAAPPSSRSVNSRAPDATSRTTMSPPPAGYASRVPSPDTLTPSAAAAAPSRRAAAAPAPSVRHARISPASSIVISDAPSGNGTHARDRARMLQAPELLAAARIDDAQHVARPEQREIARAGP